MMSTYTKKIDISFISLCLLVCINTSIIFPNTGHSTLKTYTGQSITDIDKTTEDNIDIGFWALIVSKEFDNKVDVNKYLQVLDGMTAEIKRMLAGRTSDMDKFLAVKMFLYESGIWNNNHPFTYDLDDPLGTKLEHQLLSNYLESRKGNCVSMPTLFIALMERVDRAVPFVGVKAPLHLFCRLKNRQTNDVWNIEATSGGEPTRNQWYMDKMNISQKAVDSGLYLKDLSRKEYIAELMGVLISKERKQGNIEKAMEFTDIVLKLSPGSDMGLIHKGALIAEQCYQRDKANPLPIEEKEKCKKDSDFYINKAISLGWRQQTGTEREEYLKSVKKEKSKIQQEKK